MGESPLNAWLMSTWNPVVLAACVRPSRVSVLGLGRNRVPDISPYSITQIWVVISRQTAWGRDLCVGL